MEIERITQISHRIFNTSLTEQKVARNSNPFFTGAKFQKNVLNADVVELSSKAKSSISDKITSASKRVYSTFVGSISDFGNGFYEGVKAIVDSGAKLLNGIKNTWNKINEIGKMEVHAPEINMDGAKELLGRDITQLFGASHDAQIKKMAKLDPHTQVKPMLTEALSALQSDMVQAA